MTEQDFFERLQSNPRPVVVDFWATWCGPCRMIEPGLKKAGSEYHGRVDVWRVNADEQPDLLRRLKIYGIPTLIGFRDGKEVVRRVGALSPDALGGLFEAALSAEAPAAGGGMALADRVLRLAIGAALIWGAYAMGFYAWGLLLAAAGLIVMFSAVHDRCPVWQAIKGKLTEVHGKHGSTDSTDKNRTGYKDIRMKG